MNNQDDELDKILHKIKFGTDKQYYSLDWGRTAILAWHNKQLEQAVVEARINEIDRMTGRELTTENDQGDKISTFERLKHLLSKSKEEV